MRTAAPLGRPRVDGSSAPLTHFAVMPAFIRSRRTALTAMAMLGLLTACHSDGGITLEHGVIKIQLERSESCGSSPFAATKYIVAHLSYDTCLQQFYDANPNYQPDGIDGEPVFGGKDLGGEGWKDRLCDNPKPDQIKCKIVAIDQLLTNVKQLKVTYQITDTTDIELKHLLFGPIPDAELAGCEAGAAPLMNSPNVVGEDGTMAPTWNTSSFNPTEAATNQGQAIVISASCT